MSVSGMQKLQQGIHPSSSESKRDAGDALMCTAQPVFLQHDDGRNPCSNRSGRVSGIQKEKNRRNDVRKIDTFPNVYRKFT